MTRDKNLIQFELERLQKEHEGLEKKIIDLMRAPIPEHFTIRELKRQKLELKDTMQRLERELPDSIA